MGLKEEEEEKFGMEGDMITRTLDQKRVTMQRVTVENEVVVSTAGAAVPPNGEGLAGLTRNDLNLSRHGLASSPSFNWVQTCTHLHALKKNIPHLF